MMRNTWAALAALAACAAWMAAATPTAKAGTASVPGTTINTGYSASHVTGINDKGQVIGGGIGGGGMDQGFVWRHGQLIHLDILPGGNFSEPWHINQAGEIAGSSGTESTGGPIHAVVWHHGHLVDLNPQSTLSFAYAINDHGVVVGTGTSGSVSGAAMWHNGAMTVLPGLPGSWANSATLVNNRGQAAGYSLPQGGIEHAVLWTNGRITDLGQGEAVGLDDQGQVLIQTPYGQSPARSIWDHGHTLALPAGVTWITGLSANGTVVGTYQPKAAASQHGFAWRAGDLVDLGTLTPTAVSDTGQIAGILPNGDAAAWNHGSITILLPVPGQATASPTVINDHGLVAGTCGGIATVWSLPSH